MVKDFYDEDGKHLSFPFEIEPDQKIICTSGVKFNSFGKISISPDTRSRIARRGTVIMGFYDGPGFLRGLNGEKQLNTTAISGHSRDLNFVIENHAPIPAVVTKSYPLIQVAGTVIKSKLNSKPVR